MKFRDPRIASLASAAEAAADAWSPNMGATVETDRDNLCAQLSIYVSQLPAMLPADTRVHVRTFLDIDMLEELVRDLLAVRADLLKLTGGK